MRNQPLSPVSKAAQADQFAVMIHLAIARVGSSVGNHVLQQWATEDDRKSSKRADSLLCRALLRGVLTGATGVASDRWRIGKADSGKPIVAAGESGTAPAVSLSHSNGRSA